jgi:hypothetical protein
LRGASTISPCSSADLECWSTKPEVTGSNPVTGTMNNSLKRKKRGNPYIVGIRRYQDLNISDLKMYRKILVTGPQRSGTTVCARILANDLEWLYVDEKLVKTKSLSRLFKKLNNRLNMVIQGPCFCSIAHMIDSPRTLVIIMRRNVDDIRLSQERINWNREQEELDNYFRSDGSIAEVRYECWEKYQKPNMRTDFLELSYESLVVHPFWVEKKKRTNFDKRQFQPIIDVILPDEGIKVN